MDPKEEAMSDVHSHTQAVEETIQKKSPKRSKKKPPQQPKRTKSQKQRKLREKMKKKEQLAAISKNAAIKESDDEGSPEETGSET